MSQQPLDLEILSSVRRGGSQHSYKRTHAASQARRGFEPGFLPPIGGVLFIARSSYRKIFLLGNLCPWKEKFVF